jgi:pimeloyl-ACP methyl ester carboxylesterase
MNPVRRTISIIWALATFWPRAAHPFAAPAHGPRAVADLVSRVTRLTRAGNSVLIAGHSHGALLATVAASYLPTDVAARTGLLTSGSTVVRLIEPFFGAFFNRAVCTDIARSLTGPGGTRWRNLYRLTDPIGGPILTAAPAPSAVDDSAEDDPVGKVDRLAPDPPATAVGLGADPTPRGHDYYLQDPVFAEEHARLVALLSGLPAATGSGTRPTTTHR